MNQKSEDLPWNCIKRSFPVDKGRHCPQGKTRAPQILDILWQAFTRQPELQGPPLIPRRPFWAAG